MSDTTLKQKIKLHQNQKSHYSWVCCTHSCSLFWVPSTINEWVFVACLLHISFNSFISVVHCFFFERLLSFLLWRVNEFIQCFVKKMPIMQLITSFQFYFFIIFAKSVHVLLLLTKGVSFARFFGRNLVEFNRLYHRNWVFYETSLCHIFSLKLPLVPIPRVRIFFNFLFLDGMAPIPRGQAAIECYLKMLLDKSSTMMLK